VLGLALGGKLPGTPKGASRETAQASQEFIASLTTILLAWISKALARLSHNRALQSLADIL